MDNEPEMIRKQIDETTAQLSEKMVTLEQQLSETVQSTGTAVNATVEAVQETAEAMTTAVQDAALSVSHAFDVRRQFERHPFIMLGGAVAVGYLAYEFLTTPANTEQSERHFSPANATDQASFDLGTQAAQSAASRNAVSAAYEIRQRNSVWNQLKDLAITTMIVVVQDVVTRSVPTAVDYLIGKSTDIPVNDGQSSSETESTTRRQWSPETAQRLRVASSGKVSSNNLF